MAFNPKFKRREQRNKGAVRPQGKRRSYFAAIQSEYIDYKDLNTIGRYVTQFSRIQPRRYTGNSVRHQKMLSNAIKRARYMAMLPYTMAHNSYRAE